MKTKAGNGYKLVVDGNWFFVSGQSMLDMIENKRNSCRFTPSADIEKNGNNSEMKKQYPQTPGYRSSNYSSPQEVI